jgi:hypothetical protein
MNWSVIKYLEWVFPVAIHSYEDCVTFEGVRFDDPRDLIAILYSKFLYLPALYFEEKQFGKVWEVVQGSAEGEKFDDLLVNTIAEIAFEVGFVSRFTRIVVGHDGAASEFYWLLVFNKQVAFWRAVYRYVGTQFSFMIKGGCNLKSLIERFHEKKREEFIRRFEMVEPEKAAFIRECLNEKEVELYLTSDPDFLKLFRERLHKAGKHDLVDGLFAGDLGL